MPKNLIIFFIALATLLSVYSVVQKEEGTAVYVSSLTFKNPKDADSAIRMVELVCEDEINCPDYMGALAVVSTRAQYSVQRGQHLSSRLEFCSFKLIGQDRVLTKRNCLPLDLVSRGADCSNRIKLFFSKTDVNPSESYGCAEVIPLSEARQKTTKSYDWVVVRLTHSVNRKTISKDFKEIGSQLNVNFSVLFQETIRYSKEDNLFVTTSRGIIKRSPLKGT